MEEQGQGSRSELAEAFPSPNKPRGAAHLLHYVQLGVFSLKKLNKQLQNLGMQELVAGADLWAAKEVALRHLLVLWAH